MGDNEFFLILAGMFMLYAIVKVIVRPRKPKGGEPEPICGCGHHMAYHDPQARSCSQRTRVHIGYDGRGYPKYEIEECCCKDYVGPVPAITPQLMRELAAPPSAPEPYSQDK